MGFDQRDGELKNYTLLRSWRFPYFKPEFCVQKRCVYPPIFPRPLLLSPVCLSLVLFSWFCNFNPSLVIIVFLQFFMIIIQLSRPIRFFISHLSSGKLFFIFLTCKSFSSTISFSNCLIITTQPSFGIRNHRMLIYKQSCCFAISLLHIKLSLKFRLLWLIIECWIWLLKCCYVS